MSRKLSNFDDIQAPAYDKFQKDMVRLVPSKVVHRLSYIDTQQTIPTKLNVRRHRFKRSQME